ncbi:MAG: radical SAM protein [Planctomycetes bacterium]|nr:radical SAM protein [Planctomycetota bacterium]
MGTVPSAATETSECNPDVFTASAPYDLYESILRFGRLYTFNSRKFLLKYQSSAVYEISDRFLDRHHESLAQLKLLSSLGYICSCRTFPEIKIETLVLNISHACNLACDYCFVDQGTFGERKLYMSTSTARKSVDYLVRTNQNNNRPLSLMFFGGEPLLNFSLIKETVVYCKSKYTQRDFRFAVYTNATIVNDEIALFFKKHDFTVCVSVDGSRESHDKHRFDHVGNGTWDKVVEGIRCLQKYDVRYVIRSTIDKNSVNNPVEETKILKSKFPGAAVIHARNSHSILDNDNPALNSETRKYAFDLDRESDLGRRFWQLIPSILESPSECIATCEFGLKKLAVDPKGEVYLCHVGIPHIRNNEMFHFSAIDNISKNFDLAQTLPKKCSVCWAFNLCGKGCHIKRSFLKEPDPTFCDLNFEFIERAIEYISTQNLHSLYQKYHPDIFKMYEPLVRMIHIRSQDIKPLFLRPCMKCKQRV